MWFLKSHYASIMEDGLGRSSPWLKRPVRASCSIQKRKYKDLRKDGHGGRKRKKDSRLVSEVEEELRLTDQIIVNMQRGRMTPGFWFRSPSRW